MLNTLLGYHVMQVLPTQMTLGTCVKQASPSLTATGPLFFFSSAQVKLTVLWNP